MKRRVLKRLEEVNLSPEESEALRERIETDTLSDDDRQRVLEVLRAERDVRRAGVPSAKSSASGSWPRRHVVVTGTREVALGGV